MWPLSDSQPTRKVPLVTYLIITINVIVFYFELTSPDTNEFIYTYSLVPSKVNFKDLSTLTPFLTSQFLHAGFFHIISNMWFLKVFGDNVEDEFGKIKFLLIYLISGAAGGLSQYIFFPNSEIPMLGASGAVAGVLGSYFVFFPHHRIRTLILGFGFITTTEISASLMLIYWFLTQLFSGVGSIATAHLGGVAWFAHIGGFLIGYITAQIFSSINIVEYIDEE